MRHFKLNKIRIASLERNQLFGRGVSNDNTASNPTEHETADTCASIHLHTCLDCTNPNTTIGGHDPTNPGVGTTNTR